MRIIVFDVPADRGGALTILRQYYSKAMKDLSTEWYFVISTPRFEDTHNIKILRYPWVKRSWFHRLYFEFFIAGRIVKQVKANEVISLQNLVVMNTNVPQTLYLHQSLPFVEKRFSVTENPLLWVYQNIIGRLIYKSITLADTVIVQSHWMKKACLHKVKVNPSKIEVIQPDVSIQPKKLFMPSNPTLFFYPASAAEYKNHKLIVYAAIQLLEQGNSNFEIVFTVSGNETKQVAKFYDIAQKRNLPISFAGRLSTEEVYEYYSKSVLVFPSYIETFGLPMLEAKMHGCPILASDCAFSHEILDDYNNVTFFDPYNFEELAQRMKELLLHGCHSLIKE